MILLIPVLLSWNKRLLLGQRILVLERPPLKFGDLAPALAWGIGVLAFILYDYFLFRELPTFIANFFFFSVIEAHFIYRGLEHPVIWRNGISSSGGLWYWSEIESYYWSEERTPLNEEILILDTRKKIFFFRWETQEKWIIPPHLHNEIEMILQGHPNSLLRRATLRDYPETFFEKLAKKVEQYRRARLEADSEAEPFSAEPEPAKAELAAAELDELKPAEVEAAEAQPAEAVLEEPVPAESETAATVPAEPIPAESEPAGAAAAEPEPDMKPELELIAEEAPSQEEPVQQAAVQEEVPTRQEAEKELVPLSRKREKPARMPLKASGIFTSALLMIFIGLAPVLFAYMQWLSGELIRPVVIVVLSMFLTSALGGAVSMRISNVSWPEPVFASLLAAVVLSVYALFVFQWYSGIYYLDSLPTAYYLLIGSAGIFILPLVDPVIRSNYPMPAIWQVGLAALIFLGLNVLYTHFTETGWFNNPEFQVTFMYMSTLILTATLVLALLLSLIRKDRLAAWAGSLGALVWLLSALIWFFTGQIDLI